MSVDLSSVRVERARRFGDVFLGWTVWRALRLNELLSELMPEGREHVPWPLMAAILTLGRLCEPSSELHVAESWYRKTALEDLLEWRTRRSTTTGSIERWTDCWNTRPRSKLAFGRG